MRLRVDPNDLRSIVRPDGEFVRAIAKSRNTLVAIPDGIIIQLYAYEVLERCREQLATSLGDTRVWVVPLWPPSALHAADVSAHSWLEIERMLPKFKSFEFALPERNDIAAAAVRVLGGLRFDLERYLTHFDETARTSGWQFVG